MKYSILLLLALLISACGLTDPDDADNYNIKEFYDEIEHDFLLYDLDDIYDKYSDDFIHNGRTIWTEENWWRDKRETYSQLKFEQLDITTVGDNFAEVSFIIEFSGDSDLIYQEPLTFGNLSYLHKEGGQWRIYGNGNNKSK